MSSKRDRLCLNCDNRHGCQAAAPVCLRLRREAHERHLPGKALMTRHTLLPRCRRCDLFRQCWTEETYRRALASRVARDRGL